MATLTDQQILNGVARGAYHLPDGFDTFASHGLDLAYFRNLQDDCRRLMEGEKGSDVSYGQHVTNWTGPYGTARQFSLWNTSGVFSDTSTDHNNTPEGKSFHHADRYPYLAQFIESVPGPSNFRLNVMGPESGLSPHEENVVFPKGADEMKVKMRFHLPVFTNRQTKMLLDWNWYQFHEATIYYFNNGCIHAAANSSEDKSRVHLVWDMWARQSTLDWLRSSHNGLYDSFGVASVLPAYSQEPGEYAEEGKRPFGASRIEGHDVSVA